MNLYHYQIIVTRNAGNEVIHSTVVPDKGQADRLVRLFIQEFQPEPDPEFTVHIIPITLLPTQRPV